MIRLWTAPLLALLFVWAPASKVAAACRLETLAQLPVTMIGPRPTVPASVNGHDAMFLVDSGSDYSAILASKAQAFGLTVNRDGRFSLDIYGATDRGSVGVAKVAKFALAHQTIANAPFEVGGNDLGAHLAGLIGQNILGLDDVEYDLAHGVIRLIRTENCGAQSLAYWDQKGAYSQIELQRPTRYSNHTVGEVEVNGVKLVAVFDTGAPVSVVTFLAARRARIDLDAAENAKGAPTGGFIGRHLAVTRLVTIDSFKIGNEVVHDTRLRAMDSKELDAAGWDMLLGADFFLSHRVFVSNREHRLYFTYNGGPVFNVTRAP